MAPPRKAPRKMLKKKEKLVVRTVVFTTQGKEQQLLALAASALAQARTRYLSSLEFVANREELVGEVDYDPASGEFFTMEAPNGGPVPPSIAK